MKTLNSDWITPFISPHQIYSKLKLKGNPVKESTCITWKSNQKCQSRSTPRCSYKVLHAIILSERTKV